MAANDPIAVVDLSARAHQDCSMRHLLQAIAVSSLLITPACSDGSVRAQQPDSKKQVVMAAKRSALALSGRVTDAAHVLSAEETVRLTLQLQEFERSTKHQMVVVTVPTLGGVEIAKFTRKLANHWGIGRKGHNDGVVVLVAPTEQKIRIAVGYGLEGTLTKAVCQQVIVEKMLPHFRQNDFGGGIEAGIDALIARLG